MIVINPDQTLTFKPAKKGRGSMLEISEQRGIDLVNKLDAIEMITAFILARNGKTAFPLGGGAEIYAAVLEKVQAEHEARKAGGPVTAGILTDQIWALIDGPALGDVRALIVRDIGSSFNGPLDSYLEVACIHKGALQSTGRSY